MFKKILSILPYLLLFLFIFSFNFKIVNDPDFWWHLRYGEEIVNNRAKPTLETYSYPLKGTSIYLSEWLTEVIFYTTYSNWSFLGMAILSGFVTSLAFFIPLIIFRAPFFMKMIIISTALYGLGTILLVGARAQNVGWVLFAILISLILKYLETNKKIFILWVPLIFLVWSNVHPSYFLGLGILFCLFIKEISFWLLSKLPTKIYYSSRTIKFPFFLLIVVLFSFYAASYLPFLGIGGGFSLDYLKTLLSPSDFVGESVTSSLRKTIMEWLPPVFINASGTIFLLGIIFSAGILVLSPYKMIIGNFTIIVLLFGLIYYSTLSRRNIPYFFIYFIPYSIYFLKPLLEKVKIGHFVMVLNLLAAGFALFIIVTKIPGSFQYIQKNGNSMEVYCKEVSFCPYKAIQYIKENKPKGNMFNAYDWGGYLIWNLKEYPVFIDGRTPGQKTFDEYIKVLKFQAGWKEALIKYNVGWIFLQNNPMSQSIFEKEGWKKVYSDEKAMILVRK